MAAPARIVSDPTPKGQRAILFVVLVAASLWPVAYFGGPLTFPDTFSYYRGGGVAVDMLLDRVESLLPEEVERPATSVSGSVMTEAGTVRAPPPVVGLRSLPFSILLNLSMRVLGGHGFLLLQAALTAWMILLAVELAPRGARAVVALATVGATTLPFYTAQAMPDTLAGLMVLAVALLAARPDLGRAAVVALFTVIGLATVSHYAHIPVAAVLLAGVAVAAWRSGRRGVAGGALATLTVALGVNVAISLMVPPGEGGAASEAEDGVIGRVSVAPARYPILLARSMADGPARWYLEDACAAPDPVYTICDVLDTFPADVGRILWDRGSLSHLATPEQMQRIVDEEPDLLVAAARAYPLHQATAFAANAASQFIRFGVPSVKGGRLLEMDGRELRISEARRPPRGMRKAIGAVQLAALGVAFVGIGLAFASARGEVTPGIRAALGLILVALIVNAAVCGGLSAPADRYQGRIIWVLALFGLILLARWAATRQVRPRRAARA